MNPNTYFRFEGSHHFSGTYEFPMIFACLDTGETWYGFEFTNLTDVDNSSLQYCNADWADIGFKFNGVTSTLGTQLPVDNCSAYDCGLGVYANNSSVALTNSTVKGSYDPATFGAGIYLNNCTAGQIDIDNCTIEDNGIDGSVMSTGIFLYQADPEITRTTITGNKGSGICAFASSPDLNTYDFTGGTTRHNDIFQNGTDPQPGIYGEGAEIYLSLMSSPEIRYNNIYDWNNSLNLPNGWAVYMDDFNLVNLTAKFNYWGTSYPNVYESDLFHWGSGASIIYSPWENNTIIDNADDYEAAMVLWDRGEYARAAELFFRTANDTGVAGINSIRYLTGCIGQQEQPNYRGLREFFTELAEHQNDPRVAKSAHRFSTHCLTLMQDYQGALEEYESSRINAECIEDSISAALDWLAVHELAYDGNEVNSSSESVLKQMSRLISILQSRSEQKDILYPKDFTIHQVYPNPFNNIVSVRFNLKSDDIVKVTVHDVQGRLIWRVFEGYKSAGTHTVIWNAEKQPSGIYFCRFETSRSERSVKLTLLR